MISENKYIEFNKQEYILINIYIYILGSSKIWMVTVTAVDGAC